MEKYTTAKCAFEWNDQCAYRKWPV